MAYEPPSGSNANFELLSYTPPTGTEANFDFAGAQADTRDFEARGYDNVSNQRSFEASGSGTPSNRDFEAHGKLAAEQERSFEAFGKRYIPLERTYRILIKDENGEFIGEFHNFRALRFGKRLNNFGECTFEVPANDPKAGQLISLRRYTVWIYMQEDASTTLVWAGEQSARVGSFDDNGSVWCEIHCFDWLEQLNSRYTVFEKVYDQVDAGEIAWDLIDKTQNGWDEYGEAYGSLGITQGTIEETIARDKTFVNQNIMQAIISLSDVASGFDFELTHDKVFNVFSVKGEDLTDSIVLEYGTNIQTFKILEDFTHPSNRAIILGEVIGEETLQRIERNDETSQSIYGLREFVSSESEASELANFEDRGDAVNSKYGVPLIKIEADLVKGSNPSIIQFDVGDVVGVRIKSGIYDINEQYRIFEWELVFDESNSEQLNIVLGKFTLE